MEAIDLLKKKTIKIKEEDLIQIKKRNYDYILSIPHSGTLIPKKLEHKFIINKRLLIGSDLHTDRIYKTRKGISIISKLNPYVVDMNRFKYGSKDDSMPKHLRFDALHRMSPSSKPVLKEEYLPEEKEKIFKFYDKYHLFIKKSIEEMTKKHGFALLFDCHSMSSRGPKNTPDEGKERPDFSVGTLNNTSAHPKIIKTFYDTIRKEVQKFDFVVKRDYPYSGGSITRKYKNIEEKINCIQIEVKESIFMNEGIDDDYEDDFKIKRRGLWKVNLIMKKTFKNTFKQAKELFA